MPYSDQEGWGAIQQQSCDCWRRGLKSARWAHNPKVDQAALTEMGGGALFMGVSLPRDVLLTQEMTHPPVIAMDLTGRTILRTLLRT